MWSVVSQRAVGAARRSGVDVFIVDHLHLSAVLVSPIARCDLILLYHWIPAVLPVLVGSLLTSSVSVRLNQRRYSVFRHKLQTLDLLLRGIAPLTFFVS